MKEWITDKLDIAVARIAIWRLKIGYGQRCETTDLEDFPEHKEHPECPRCPTCKAYEIIDWLEDFIKLIKNP